MKKTFSSLDALRAAAVALGVAGCALTNYGNRINAEHAALEELEKKREDAEARYVLVLNNLERFPDDPRMEKEKDQVHRKIQELNVRVEEQRRIFDQSIKEWEQKILQDKIQKAMIDKEVRENKSKVEGEWHTTP